METRSRQPSAKIYQFPQRLGSAGARHREAELASIAALRRMPITDYGSAWYHDAAIREADPAPKA